MKLSGNKIQVEVTPLKLTGSLNITGGSAVQFFNGTSYTPNREGTPSSPILITHTVTAINPDTGQTVTDAKTTTFYENGVVISSSTEGYELLDGGVLKVTKNIHANTSVEIKAITQFVDSRSGKVYERHDVVMLRTILKSEAQYQLDLSQSGVIYFDGYRNPNTTTTVTATLKKGSDVVTDLTGITFKWLNSAGLDAVENELYADSVSSDGKTLTVDKTYIDNEHIVCEAWQGEVLLASDTVTFVRKFNSFRSEIRIPELSLLPVVNVLNCSVSVTDILGNVDVDAAFLASWIVSENGVERKVTTGANAQIHVSSINMNAQNLKIYADLKRREAYAALTTEDPDELITDDDDNVLTVETYGA